MLLYSLQPEAMRKSTQSLSNYHFQIPGDFNQSRVIQRRFLHLVEPEAGLLLYSPCLVLSEQGDKTQCK